MIKKLYIFILNTHGSFTCSCLNSSANLAASADAFLARSSEFFNSDTASSKSAWIAAASLSNLRFCAARFAFDVLNSLILSAASCKSFSAALRALSACSFAALTSSNSLAIRLALRSAAAAASPASSRWRKASSTLAACS